MPDVALISVGLSTWGFCAFRYWRKANHVDRYECMILRPLSLSVGLVALRYLANRAWLADGAAVLWGPFIGGAAAGTLRKDRSFTDLANPLQPLAGGEILMLSHEDSSRMTFLLPKTERKQRRPRLDAHILLPVHHIGHRAR